MKLFIWALPLGLCIVILTGCGGGGSSSTSSSATAGLQPSFTLLTPGTITMAPASSIDVEVSKSSLNGFSGTAQVSLSGLPVGVTATPATLSITSQPNGTASATVTLTAAASATSGASTITFQGASGSLTASASSSLAIAAFSSFALAESVTGSLTLRRGGSSQLIISATSGAGANNYVLQLTVEGLPTGVSASWSSSAVQPNVSTTLTLTAAADAPIATGLSAQIIATRTNDGARQASNLPLNVAPVAGQLPGNRSDFVRTDDTPEAVVYDPVHNLVFASLTNRHRVAVISLANNSVIAEIPVSAPAGLSLSPDFSRLLVGSWTKQLTWIDTASLQVVKRDVIPVPSNVVTTYEISPVQAIQVANGKVLLLPYTGVTSASEGFVQPLNLMEWDPASGTNKILGQVEDSYWVANADHSKVVISGSPLSVYDSATDSLSQLPGISTHFPAINPAGTQITSAASGLLGADRAVQFYDLSGKLTGEVDVGQFTGIESGTAYSADGHYLYISVPGPIPTLITVDAANFQLVATAPAQYTATAYSTSLYFNQGVIEGVDASGRVISVADHGVGITDSAAAANITQYTQGLKSLLIATPDEGPLNGGTRVQFSTQSFFDLPDVYFGNMLASSSLSGSAVAATAPPSPAAGPVNIRVITPDGNSSLLPLGFAYGATAVQYGDIAAPPAGGVPVNLFGYGIDAGAPASLPEVTVGGVNATVLSTSLVPASTRYPFPLEKASFTAPAGNAGPADIVLTSASGTATLKGRLHYLSSVTDYSFPGGGSDNCMLFDAARNQVYFGGGAGVLVFSLTTHSWQPTYAVPYLTQLKSVTGLALTPDGTHLLTANFGDASMGIIDLNNPGASVAVAVPTNGSGMLDAEPFQVVATSKNTAFLTTAVPTASGGGGALYEIDLSTHSVTRRTDANLGFLQVAGNFMTVSADGTVAALVAPDNSGGPLSVWHASDDQWRVYEEQGQFWTDVTLSGDGNIIVASSDPDYSDYPYPIIYDSQQNARAEVDYTDFQGLVNRPGILLDASGALLYSPTSVGFDILDTRTGELRERMRLPEQIGGYEKFTAVTPDGSGLLFLTSSGFAEVHLDAVPLAVGSISPSSAAAGAQVTLRGTGFTAGTEVQLNGIAAIASYVDSSIITFIVPSLPSGPARLTLTRPDSTYNIDAAFIVP